MHTKYGAWVPGVAALLTLATSSPEAHPEPTAPQSVDCQVAASIQQFAHVEVDATHCKVQLVRPGRYEFRASQVLCRSNGGLKVSVAPSGQTAKSSPGVVPPKCYYALVADGVSPTSRDWLPAEPGANAAIELEHGAALNGGQAVDLWMAIESTRQTSVGEAGFHLRVDVMLLDQTAAVVP